MPGPSPQASAPLRKRMKRCEVEGGLRLLTFSCPRRLPARHRLPVPSVVPVITSATPRPTQSHYLSQSREALARSVGGKVVPPASDTVTTTYNRQGQKKTVTDQRGVVHTYVYDALGRLSMDRVTTCPSGVDDTVLCIETTYDAHGRVEHVRSYDSDDNSGVVLNDVQMEYNGFNQLTREYQEHAGAVNTSTTPKVQYGYEPGAASSVQTNNIRPTTLTYPNGRVITYQYGATDSLNDKLNRANEIYDTTNSQSLAQYVYLGSGLAIRVIYPEPEVMLDLWGLSETTGQFDGLDQFNRVTDQNWLNDINGTPTTIDQYTYTYDRNSNRLTRGNGTHAPFSEAYGYDNLNRLTSMVRGDSSINFTEAWNLDETGNWLSYDTTSDGTTPILSQTRTTNTANEITDITSTPTWADPSYDAAGNMTGFVKPGSPSSNLAATYDGWNRVTSIDLGGAQVRSISYDGRRRRLSAQDHVAGSPDVLTRYFFDRRWRELETRQDASAAAHFQTVWSIVIPNESICRDAPTTARVYVLSQHLCTPTSLVSSSAVVVERYGYESYGSRTVFNATWTPVTITQYEWDFGFQTVAILERDLVLARNRAAHSMIGTWCQRDPAGFVDGSCLYEFDLSSPQNRADYSGLICGLRWTMAGARVDCSAACQNMCNSRSGIGYATCFGACYVGCAAGVGFANLQSTVNVSCDALNALLNSDVYKCLNGMVALLDLIDLPKPINTFVESADCLMNIGSVLQTACNSNWGATALYGAFTLLDCAPLAQCPLSSIAFGPTLPESLPVWAASCYLEPYIEDVVSYLLQNLYRNGSWLPRDQCQACERVLGVRCPL